MIVPALLAAAAVAGGAHAQSRPAVPPFRHVVVVVFENKERSQVLGSGAAPTFDAMARRYASLTRYYGVTHPSLPNYLALVSGSTQGVSSDCTSCVASGRNLADSLDAAKKTWKVYAEDLPAVGFTGAFSRGYAKKHDPLMYFEDVSSSPARLARIVPFTHLRKDVYAGALPDFSLVVPNLCHSMHDCSVATGDAWLKHLLLPLLKLPETVVFVVFDEGATNLHGGGHVPALALGTAVRARARYAGVTGHYGLLRTIEAAWNLPLLGHSARSRAITGIWR
jgi:phospholipase C